MPFYGDCPGKGKKNLSFKGKILPLLPVALVRATPSRGPPWGYARFPQIVTTVIETLASLG